MEALKLACRYSWNCQMATHRNISKILFDFIVEGKRSPEIIKKLLKFLNSYESYCNIASATKLDIFDINVVSAYWKGLSAGYDPEIWHNYTTLTPILNMPINYIREIMVDEDIVHPAKIIKKDEEDVVVEYRPVIKENDDLLLKEYPIEKKVINPFVKDCSIGDLVTIHFESIVEKITEDEFKTLASLTDKSLRKFNARRK